MFLPGKTVLRHDLPLLVHHPLDHVLLHQIRVRRKIFLGDLRKCFYNDRETSLPHRYTTETRLKYIRSSQVRRPFDTRRSTWSCLSQSCLVYSAIIVPGAQIID